MRISLTVATLGRTVELKRLLETLDSQVHTDFEVLIADQNPEGFLDSTVAPFAPRLKLKVVHTPPRGVSAARNALLPHITGDIVAFPDDDCWYAPDTLAQVVSFFSQNPLVYSIMGVWGDCPLALVGTEESHSPRALKKHELFVRGETYVQFYRRTVVDILGDFDPELGPGTGLPYGGGEDTDYALRAAQVHDVWRVPTVKVFHPLQDLEGPPNVPKLRAYASGRMYLLRKHNFPLWFQILNVIYPLCCAVKEGRRTWGYRWQMFIGRIRGLLRR